MEQRNEPTTAEIVKALRNCHGTPCETCAMRTGKEEFLCSAEHLAARLEQLERENAKKDVTIAELTARLGSAEELAEARNVLRVRALQERDEATARAEKAEADVEDAHQRGYEEGMDEARHQYEEDGFV